MAWHTSTLVGDMAGAGTTEYPWKPYGIGCRWVLGHDRSKELFWRSLQVVLGARHSRLSNAGVQCRWAPQFTFETCATKFPTEKWVRGCKSSTLSKVHSNFEDWQHTSALAVKAQFAYIEFKVWILTATELPFVLARSSWASPHCSCIGDGSPRQTHQGLPEFLPLPPFLLSLMSKWPTTFPVDNGAGRVTPPDREGGAVQGVAFGLICFLRTDRKSGKTLGLSYAGWSTYASAGKHQPFIHAPYLAQLCKHEATLGRYKGREFSYHPVCKVSEEHAVRPYMAAQQMNKVFVHEHDLRNRPHALIWLSMVYGIPAGTYACQMWGTEYLREG
eukprot:1152120-Pelagomonas_calceolata.AAC.5